MQETRQTATEQCTTKTKNNMNLNCYKKTQNTYRNKKQKRFKGTNGVPPWNDRRQMHLGLNQVYERSTSSLSHLFPTKRTVKMKIIRPINLQHQQRHNSL